MLPEKYATLYAGLLEFCRVYMPARGLSKKTREEYQRDTEQVIEHVQPYDLNYWHQVGSSHLQGYLTELTSKGLKASTQRRKVFALKTLFRFLFEYGYVADGAADKLIPPKTEKRDPRFLTEDEYEVLLTHIESNRDQAIVMFFLQTGIRLSELVAMSVRDLQLPKQISSNPEDVGFVYGHRQGTKEGRLPLNYKVCQVMVAWLVERKQILQRNATTEDAVFLNKYGNRISARSIQRLITKHMAATGIRHASIQTLRHTMATHYLAKGGDLRSVQGLIGHQSITTTQQYLNLSQKVRQRMVQALAL